jgi:hypothetical protein
MAASDRVLINLATEGRRRDSEVGMGGRRCDCLQLLRL